METEEWIPNEWRGLFVVLHGSSGSLERAEKWLSETLHSCYGSTLSWQEFITALTSLVPYVNEKKLVFLPRLLLLPVQLQVLLVAFLYHHRRMLHERYMQELLKCLQHSNVSHKWLIYLRQQFEQELHKEIQLTYCVSDYNRKRYDTLLSMLKLDVAQGKDWCIWSDLADCKQTPPDSTIHSVSPVIGSQLAPIDVDTPCTQQLHNSETCNSQTDNKPAYLDISQMHKEARSLDFAENEDAESSTMEDLCSQSVPTVELQVLAVRLFDIWQNGEDTKKLPMEIEVFSKATQEQIEHICSSLHLCDLSEASLLVACTHMQQVAPLVAHSHSVCFAQHALLPKLEQLDQIVSRVLLQCFTQFALMFGHSLVEAIMPTIQQLDNPKADLIIKLIKSSFDMVTKQELMSQVCRANITWTAAVLSVLHALIDSKVALDETTMNQVLQSTQRNSVANASNLKFGKLLQSLLNKYGNQLTSSHLTLLHEIVTSHSSFLKKSLTTTVNKLNANPHQKIV